MRRCPEIKRVTCQRADAHRLRVPALGSPWSPKYQACSWEYFACLNVGVHAFQGL